MNGFLKTLFGDRRTVAAVALVLLLEAVLLWTAAYPAGALLVPPAVLAAVAWLAR